MGVKPARPSWNAVAYGVAIALLALHFWSLTRFPEPFVDEAWFGNRAWSLLTRADTIGTLDHGVVDRMPGSRLFFPLVPVLLQAGALLGASSPNLDRLRLLSLGFAAILAGAVWCTARSIRDAPTGTVALVLLGVSSPFLYSGHLARYDIMAAACGYTGIALYLTNRGHLLRAMAGGLTAGLAIEFHPFGSVISAGFTLLVLHDAIQGLESRTIRKIAIAGLIAGASVYPLIHVVPQPESYFEIGKVVYGPSHVPIANETTAAFWNTLVLLFAAFGTASLLVPIALIVLAVSPSVNDRRLLVTALSILIAFSVLVRNKLDYYAILIAPVLVICLAAAIRKVADKFAVYPTLVVVALCVTTIIVVDSGRRTVRPLRSNGYAVFHVVQEKLKTVIRPADKIMGSQTYWFGLSDHVYFSWEQLVYLRRAEPQLSLTEALARLRPDVFVRDAHLDRFILETPGSTVYSQLLRLPKLELEGWLAANATVVTDFDGGIYGRVRAYRIAWPPGPSLR